MAPVDSDRVDSRTAGERWLQDLHYHAVDLKAMAAAGCPGRACQGDDCVHRQAMRAAATALQFIHDDVKGKGESESEDKGNG